jgi:hypothetical protein
VKRTAEQMASCMSAVTNRDLERICAGYQRDYDAARRRNGYTYPDDTRFEFTKGPTYARIVRAEYYTSTERKGEKLTASVVVFVDLSNGDIHPAHGWKAPHAHRILGNIFATVG